MLREPRPPQLWNSNRVFKGPNGTEAVTLRIRNRLGGSIVLDALVWWREEFGGFMGVYPPPLMDDRNDLAANRGVNSSNKQTLNEGTSSATAKADYPSFQDDPMLTEFGWPVGDELFSSIWADGEVGTI